MTATSIDTSTTDSSPLNNLATTNFADGLGNIYVYLQGCASTVAGSWVTYTETGSTALLAANAIGRVAIAQVAANSTIKYGYYLVSGTYVTAACDVVASGASLFIDGTSGRVDDDVVTGDFITNAISTAASSGNQVAVRIDFPWVTNVLG